MSARQEVLDRLTSLRLHQHNGRRAPHKPLLVLLAMGQLTRGGSSELSWSQAQEWLSDLIAEFGPASKTGRAQRAAYPFTRLRSDGVWTLSRDVPMDLVGPLATHNVVGRLDADTESALRRDPELVRRVARALVEQHFPPTIAPDVLTAAGLDPDDILQAPGVTPVPGRRRDPAWRVAVLQAWDRQCAFCGYDPQGTSYGGPIVLAFVALLFVGLILATNAGWPLIASAHASRDGNAVEVRNAHPRFAEHAAALQQWAAQQQWVAQQQWAAQQGYRQPHQWQPHYANPQYPEQQPHDPGGTMPS